MRRPSSESVRGHQAFLVALGLTYGTCMVHHARLVLDETRSHTVHGHPITRFYHPSPNTAVHSCRYPSRLSCTKHFTNQRPIRFAQRRDSPSAEPFRCLGHETFPSLQTLASVSTKEEMPFAASRTSAIPLSPSQSRVPSPLTTWAWPAVSRRIVLPQRPSQAVPGTSPSTSRFQQPGEMIAEREASRPKRGHIVVDPRR
ncbi:hypothetical protein P280DRAFT_115001 [Massarina eburnea CBS 473.64]|uniref:Uncharacterized protein n=1 Tax=Massarina eburnea CBS 473.64 TaxID=1395130 RepID=A0A6A6SFJ8_9PLEO|nr:hypothetical protein P280DRAFT_115001 [Massarina eburnea CBS 473.64]